jgi:hypothetical protein
MAKYPAHSKKINGESYSLNSNVNYKGLAREVAGRSRSEGKKARVVKSSDGWAIYTKKK